MNLFKSFHSSEENAPWLSHSHFPAVELDLDLLSDFGPAPVKEIDPLFASTKADQSSHLQPSPTPDAQEMEKRKAALKDFASTEVNLN